MCVSDWEGNRMNFYVKLFIIAFIGFLVLFGSILFALDLIYSSNQTDVNHIVETTTEPGDPIDPTDEAIDLEDDRTELRKIAESSDTRINIIAFGLNEMLADTMMLFSYDTEQNKLDIMSIPRDTYNVIEGYNASDQKKLNAIYGLSKIGGVNGMKTLLSEFLDIPIHYYLKVDFNAVEAVVNTLGGYEVTIPYDMDYDDYYDKPPLHIHLKKGYQVLNGADTVKFLRFRKNNSGTILEGDIQRIPRQQHFVKTMMQKAISSKLPSVINTIIGGKYVATDMTLEEALTFALKAASLSSDNIVFYTLEGEAKWINGVSYWIHDPAALEKTLYGFYGFELDGDSDLTEEPSTETTTVKP